MGKSSIVVESYPSLNANHKNDKKQSKTRAAAKLAKIARFNAQDKANLKTQRRLAQKTIDKSRQRKRLLKNTELEVKTPQQEMDAYHEVEGVEFELAELKLIAAYNQKVKANLKAQQRLTQYNQREMRLENEEHKRQFEEWLVENAC